MKELSQDTIRTIFIALVESISEDYYTAGWHDGIEKALFARTLAADDRRSIALHELSEATGFWIVWREWDEAPQLIEVAQFKAEKGSK
jgi:hypothetical protein